MNKAILALFFLLSFYANGQEDFWPLQKCLAMGLENNIDIKIKQLEIARAGKLYTNPFMASFPTISLGGNHGYNFGSTVNPATNGRVSLDIQSDNFYLSANMNILDFAVLAETQKGKIDIEIAKADKALIEYEYKLQLLEKYFDVLFLQELIKIQKEQLQNTTLNLVRIEKEVIIGSKPQSDLYDIQLSLSQDKNQLLETEQLFALQKLQLFQFINVKGQNLSEVMLEPYLTNGESISNEKHLHNPRIEFAELTYKSAKKEISILKSANLPNLSAYYSLSSFYSTVINQPNNTAGFKDQLDDNKNHNIGLQLAIPVFSGFRNKKQIAASGIQAEKVRLALEQEKLKLEQQIESEVAMKDQYFELVADLQNTLGYARKSFRATQLKFTNGLVDAFTYTSVKNQLLTSEYNLLKSNLRLQYIAVKINLLQKNQI